MIGPTTTRCGGEVVLKTRRVPQVLVTLTLAASAACTGCGVNQAAPSTPERVSVVQASWVTDISNPRKLAGVSDVVVFTGKVLNLASTDSSGSLPTTQFTVQTMGAQKGAVDSQVTVVQEGGLAADGSRVIFEDDTMLEPGKSYIFAARRNAQNNHYTVIPVYGHVELTIPGSTESRALVSRMRDAVINEIDEVPGR